MLSVNDIAIMQDIDKELEQFLNNIFEKYDFSEEQMLDLNETMLFHQELYQTGKRQLRMALVNAIIDKRQKEVLDNK